jgi:hypothetical protein
MVRNTDYALKRPSWNQPFLFCVKFGANAKNKNKNGIFYFIFLFWENITKFQKLFEGFFSTWILEGSIFLTSF